jgi:hypothetical protein
MRGLCSHPPDRNVPCLPPQAASRSLGLIRRAATHPSSPPSAGGVYIAGGITPKLLPRVLAGSLKEAFLLRKGRPAFHALLAETPLFVVTNGAVGQLGAVEVAKRLLG